MGIKTKVTEMLGIEHPIVCGGLTGCGTPELAAAISNAGGLGMITVHNAGTPEKAREWIAQCRSLTNKPFGCNLTILPSMDPPPYEEYAKVIIESGVKVVETAGNNPKKWVTLFKNAGLITIHKCVAIRHALSAQRMGVDIVSMDGFECAGHPGEDDVTNMILQAKAAQVLKVPYLCSGGVGTGSQLVAALAMGADGVNCGTRFCVSQECNWPASFKKKCIDNDERNTTLMFRALKNTTRVFRNEVARQVETVEREKGMNLEFADLAALVGGKRGREAEKNGDAEGGIWTAGQVIGLIDDIPTCQQIVDRMMGEAEECYQRRLAGVFKARL